jgi:hypothetical protein
MATIDQIPFPKSGIDVFGEGMNRMMQNMLERQKMAQMRGLKEKELSQVDKHFMQQQALREQQERRMAQNAGLQRQLYNLNLQKAQREADPAKQMAYMQQMMQGIRDMRARNQQGGNPEKMPMQPFVGEGMPSTEEIERKVQAPSQEQLQQGFNDFTPEERFTFEMASGHKLPTNPALTGAARDAQSMELLRKQYGKDSAIVKDAENIQKAKTQQALDLSAIRNRQLNGLKPGDIEIKDPETGQTVGFKKQTTDKQKEAAKNTVLFNKLYPLVYKGAAIFSGPGATMKLENAARNYNTNPKARKLIDDFLISLKATNTATVTEASRFSAGHTNQSYNRFVETLKAEDIPEKLKKWIKMYQIPAEANLKAGYRWQKELNNAEKLANKSIPSHMDYYFDPEKQFAAEQARNSSPENPEEEMQTDTVLMIKNGEYYDVPSDKVAIAESKGYKRG